MCSFGLNWNRSEIGSEQYAVDAAHFDHGLEGRSRLTHLDLLEMVDELGGFSAPGMVVLSFSLPL